MIKEAIPNQRGDDSSSSSPRFMTLFQSPFVTGFRLMLSAWSDNFRTVGKLKWFAVCIPMLLAGPGNVDESCVHKCIVSTDRAVPFTRK